MPRLCLAMGGLLLIKAGYLSDFLGIGILFGVLIWQKIWPTDEDHK
jgi:UPF0716 family protein affecting phage T7 exclusion